MPKQTNTPLGYIMDMLYIQGTQLAKMVHVDRTVISRWKNGRAELNMKSGYFEDIVNAMLDINEQQGLTTLERFFSSLTKKNVSKRKELQKLLATWLVSSEFEKQFKAADAGGSLYNATYRIYRGLSGKADALNYLLDMLEELEAGERVCLYDVDSAMPYEGQEEYLEVKRRMAGAVALAGDICMIVYMNRPLSQVFEICKYWLPVLTNKNARLCYTYDMNLPFYSYMYSLHSKLAVVGIDSEGDNAKLYTAAYDDQMTLAQVEKHFENNSESLPLLFRALEGRDVCLDFADAQILDGMRERGTQYIFSEDFPLIVYSGGVAEKAIANLGLNFLEESRAMEFAKSCAEQAERLFCGGNTKIVLSMDRLLEIKEAGAMLSPGLSVLLGHEVFIDPELVIAGIAEFVVGRQGTKNIEFALVPSGVESFLPDADLIIKQDELVYIAGRSGEMPRAVSAEFSVVKSFFAHADGYCKKLPRECTSAEFVVNGIKALL